MKKANVLYPHLSDRKDEMARIAQAQKKRAPFQEPLLKNAERGATSPLDGRAVKKEQ
jgi:hypothetical protein